MPVTVVIFAYRKPGTSPANFKNHYENVHVPLLQSIAGATFPITHTRHYIQRVPGETVTSDSSNAAHPAVTFAGQQSDFDYDAFAELAFEDTQKFQEFFGTVSAPEAAAKIAEDEEKFLDRGRTAIASVDQVNVTKGSG